jgi:CelD/BcsL family acetyltransferase involved in cellulose biosynthesis
VCFQATGADGAEAVFGALLELHGARWAARGERGVLDGPGVEAFHREVVRGFLERGWLRLFALRVEGRLAAVHYGFSAKGRAYYYLGGFDPAFHQLSPGSLMVLHAIEEALREGAGEFDFLRGREAYKYAWGGVDRRQYRRVLRVVR